MTAPTIVVVSTAANCPAAARRCCQSVARDGARHLFCAADEATFDAARTVIGGADDNGSVIWRAQSKIENLLFLIGNLDQETIVIWLDGDDELTPGAAARVLQEYGRDGWETWLTYGSFHRSDGVRDRAWHEPFGTRYGSHPRGEAWRASHLRTFRAGLFQAIPRRYLERETGIVFTTCDDRAVMLPMIEMAGERYSVIQDVLCVYDYAHDQSMTMEQRAIETCDRLQIHGMRPLAPLKARPW